MDDPDHRPDARAPTVEDLARLCDALNREGARYVLIGGFAVIAHGFTRTTKDIDFLVDDAPDNIIKIKAALAILSDNAAREIDPGDVQRYSVVRIADEVVVDLLGKACGLTYQDLQPDMETFEVRGVNVPVASKRSLVLTKRTARPSDLTDRRFLELRIADESE